MTSIPWSGGSTTSDMTGGQSSGSLSVSMSTVGATSALANTNNAGASTLVGGVEETIGMHCPSISSLARQYESPVGQRVILFVRTNANCCLQGGVETILKLQKSKISSSRAASRSPSRSSSNTTSSVGVAASNLDHRHQQMRYQHQHQQRPRKKEQQQEFDNCCAKDYVQEASDPFAYLNDGVPSHSYAHGSSTATPPTAANANANATATAAPATDTPKAPQPQRSKTPNLGRFLKKVAKQTTASLERGMQELAIKADQGRNPDMLTSCLFFRGELIAMTDSVPVPRVSAGVAFSIPLWIPPRIEDSGSVTVKLFIHSQASLIMSATGKIKTKHFLLGHVELAVGQMRQLLLRQRKGFFSFTLNSSIVADGQLLFCVLPDLKLPALGERGWSLSDPKFSGFASGLYNVPLDQSYLLNTAQKGLAWEEHWLVATERAMESTLVLPIAAAYASICTQACQVSVQHAQALTTHLLAKRTEQKGPGHCARVQLDIHHLQIDDNMYMTPQLSSVLLNLAWQPPDSIFELELLPSVSVPVGNHSVSPLPSSTLLQQHTLQFFPPVCTTGILPAVLKAYEGRMPPVGYMLGNLRMQLSITKSNRQQETWEAMIVLEQHAAHLQHSKLANAQLQLPVYSLTSGHKVGALFVSLSIQLESPAQPLPQILSPQRGLVALVGLRNLVEGVTPAVDDDDPSLDADLAALQQSKPFRQTEEMKRRQHQLATMGSFMSHAYLDQHVRSRRKVDLECFQNREEQYRAPFDRCQPKHGENQTNVSAIGGDEEVTPSWQDMSPRAFRPSSSRQEVVLSGIPFNSHNASLSLDVMSSNDHNPQPDGALFHNITCGAPADHAAGFGNVFLDKTFTSPIGSVSGGLRRLEAKRSELAQVVRLAQTQLISGVSNFFHMARQQQKYLNHVPARHSGLQNMRWKVFEALHAYHHVTWVCAARRANVFSQALGIAVTSYLTSLSDMVKCQTGWPELWARHGYLVSFEGLLSAAGKELGMIEDASVGISMLHMVRIILTPDDGTDLSLETAKVAVLHSPVLKWIQLSPSSNGTSMQYILRIGVHSHYFEQRIPPCLKNKPVRLFPVLFQVGVDIRQWGAHAGSQMKSQFAGDSSKDTNVSSSDGGGLLDDEDDDVGVADDDVLVALNYEALQKMNAYAHLISPSPGNGAAAMNPFDVNVPPGQQQASQQQLSAMSVHPSLKMLHGHIVTSSGKMNHSILDEAATMAQQLGGGGVTFCKSGKDRTAMHITYKQAQFANRFCQQQYTKGLTDTTLEDATKMRIFGTRLPICEKNVGQALYAFNSLQSKFMPDALKPPPSTLAGFLKGGRVFGQGGIES